MVPTGATHPHLAGLIPANQLEPATIEGAIAIPYALGSNMTGFRIRLRPGTATGEDPYTDSGPIVKWLELSFIFNASALMLNTRYYGFVGTGEGCNGSE